MAKKIIVTGGAGFLGAILVPMLLERGHDVTVIDNFRYGQTSLMACCHHPNLKIINRDVRIITGSKGFLGSMKSYPPISDADIIIPLAALVGAPVCDKDPDVAYRINSGAISDVCNTAYSYQTILYPMTNSGYGIGTETECTEKSELLPISIYGKSKVAAETLVLSHPRGISFRFATLFGCSPRMRLDLLVNDFTYRAVKDKALTLFEGGFRRNYLHVRDAARAFVFAIENAEKLKMFRQAYNIGLSSANLTKRELCAKIAEHVPDFVYHESAVGTDPDKRDYVVSNAKIEALGWKPQYTLDDGIQELIKGYQMPLESEYRNA